MKKCLIFALVFALVLLGACGNKQLPQTDDTDRAPQTDDAATTEPADAAQSESETLTDAPDASESETESESESETETQPQTEIWTAAPESTEPDAPEAEEDPHPDAHGNGADLPEDEATADGETEQEEATEPDEETAPEEDPVLTVCRAEDLPDLHGEIVYIADNTDPASHVVFQTDVRVRDFRVLKLTDPVINDEGEMGFSVKTLYHIDELTPEHPLLLTITFYGDTPGYGVAYVDKLGHQRTFALDMSGMDGSLILWEFDAAD